jgi:MFS family permease
MADDAVGVAVPAGAERRTILGYSAVMVSVISFASPAFGIFIPLTFLLKNKLHLSANGLSFFALWATFPAYLCFLFGYIRDAWSPLGKGDRGYFLLFGGAGAVVLIALSFAGASLAVILAGAFCVGIAYLFIWGAWNGLATTVGQQRALAGEMSSVWNIASTIAGVASFVVGGMVSDRLEHLGDVNATMVLFLIFGALFAAMGLLGLWKPKAVFAGSTRPRQTEVRDIGRLLRHRPIYPALAAFCLWQFAPGSQTALQYHLSNSLHASDSQWGLYNAIYTLSFLPTLALFGVLSRRYSLRTLLLLGTLIGIPQMIPLAFVTTANSALIAAVPIGLMGGLATAAYLDLLIRSSPKGLEGTLMMLAWSLYSIAIRFGDLLGTALYQRFGGFGVCVIATTIAYALILPVLRFVPRELVEEKDG